MGNRNETEQGPIIIEANNGAQVTVEIKVIRRDLDHDSLRWWADMISQRPNTSVEAVKTMTKKGAFIFAGIWLATASFFPHTSLAAPRFSVSDFAVKTECGRGKYCDVAYKGKVTNEGADEEEGHAFMQAVDRDGFEIKVVSLTCRLKPGESKTVTDTTMIEPEKVRKIVKWQQKE